ncbi:MAG: glycosyl transferase family 2 [Thiothrix nivea]|nr:MAG: glycosyl transferase family 2 [Thiothrix nivea]
MKKTICLNMIVKNEIHVIKRCFDSLKNHIDYWVISDTGSTDGTQEYIKSYFKEADIPGELFEDEWKDFAHNRNIALKAALEKSDYILFMDADDYIEWNNNTGFNQLTADAYMLPMSSGKNLFSNIKLIKSDSEWEWQGVLHETLRCKSDYVLDYYTKDILLIRSTRDGSRNNDPEKYLNDAKILEKALIREPLNTRYQFYLARSYYDAELFEKSLDAFEKRINMGGWEEEVYYSFLSIARCKLQLNSDSGEIINSYIKSYLYRPQRLEGLYEAIFFCRTKKLYTLGYQIGCLVKHVFLPKDILFLEPSVYEWRFLDEFSICAIESNRPSEIISMLNHLIRSEKTPVEQKNRLKSNLEIAIKKINPLSI